VSLVEVEDADVRVGEVADVGEGAGGGARLIDRDARGLVE
jgi:hypothetical protein